MVYQSCTSRAPPLRRCHGVSTPCRWLCSLRLSSFDSKLNSGRLDAGEREIATPRGGRWSARTVSDVLARLNETRGHLNQRGRAFWRRESQFVNRRRSTLEPP